MISTDIHGTAVLIEQDLRSFWRDGVQPNRHGLDHIRSEADHFGITERIVQGDGRPRSRFPFRDASLDYKFVPERKLERLNDAVHDWLWDEVFAQAAIVFWPCDIDQFEPYGRRGRTLIPYQLALVSHGYELKKRGDDIYLPEGFKIWDIPQNFPMTAGV